MPVRPPQSLLDVRGLTVARGRTVLLDAVDWRVGRDEHWVVLGPNGCGKTSLLKALTGYLSPTTGTITLLGLQYGRTDWRDLRRKIGLVTSALQASIPPAEPALETVISGKYAQLDLWAPVTRADRVAARRWLRFVGGTRLGDRPWLYLSQGERQRVLIARALVLKPSILIFDEATSALDNRTQAIVTESLNRLKATRILVAHRLSTIRRADRIYVIEKGKVVQQGRFDELVRQPGLFARLASRQKV